MMSTRHAGISSSSLPEKTFSDYQSDPILRSAIERQLIIIGEALAQAAKIGSDLAELILELPQIIALRNTLVHGYAVIRDQDIWAIIQDEIPPLQQSVQQILNDNPPPTD